MIAYQEAGAIVVLNDRGDVQSQTPRLSLVFPYYRNPRMLHRHMLVWRGEWPAELKREVEIVIVDDGSPGEAAADAMAAMWNGDKTGLPSIALYRVTEDRLWHQHGARNLGAHVATAPDLLMTDVDHIVPPATLREVLSLLPLARRAVVTFGRVDAPPTLTWRAEDWPDFERTRREDGSLKPHVNSFVVSRRTYWDVGGYDESFCGVYGTDMDFRRRLFGPRVKVLHLDEAPLIRVGRDVIDDASTRAERKTPMRSAQKKAIVAAKLLRGERDRIKTLDFPWERVF